MATHNGPETRLAQYLAKIAGEDVTTPKPQTEAEVYLDKIAENGGSGGGGTGGVFVVNLTRTPDMSAEQQPAFSYTSDKTFSEIESAVLKSQVVVALLRTQTPGDNSVLVYASMSYIYVPSSDDNAGEIVLLFPPTVGNAVYQTEVTIDSENSISGRERKYPSNG